MIAENVFTFGGNNPEQRLVPYIFWLHKIHLISVIYRKELVSQMRK